MITDILQERTPEQKPRFFLHDEIREWLSDNLQISTKLYPNHSTNYHLQQALHNYKCYAMPVVGLAIESEVKIAGTTIQLLGTNVPMMENEVILGTVLHHQTSMQYSIDMLIEENKHLKRRIELLENPLPI